MAGHREIAATTDLPHPYPEGMAEAWIAGQAEKFLRREEAVFAVTLRETLELIGAMSLKSISVEHSCACLDYWIGREHWGRGYATESLVALLEFSFEELNLHRIQGFSLSSNQRSIRVMAKAGLQKEGHLRKHVHCLSGFEDLEVYAMLRAEYFARKRSVAIGRLARQRKEHGGVDHASEDRGSEEMVR